MTWNEWTIQRFNFFIPVFILSLYMIKVIRMEQVKFVEDRI